MTVLLILDMDHIQLSIHQKHIKKSHDSIRNKGPFSLSSSFHAESLPRVCDTRAGATLTGANRSGLTLPCGSGEAIGAPC